MQQFSGTEYLKIDIANCYGLDKEIWANRIQWVDANRGQLSHLSSKASSPILFRKAVRALETVERGRPTNHIMGLDATASGIQIMGAMSGCFNTAESVNLIDSGVRQCFYATVAGSMNTLPGVNITRDIIKKPVMTVFYGSTEQPKSILGEGPELVAFYQALKEKATGAYDLMGVFQSYWNPGAEYHQWTLPDGHVARVPVTQTVEKSLEIDELDHMRFAYRTKIVCPKAQSRALAANIVHSVDGWIVRQMVLAAHKQGFWMAPVHDCFFASPNHMNQVRANYVKILAWIAQANLVETILHEISGNYIPYMKHTTNLHQHILGAEYALS